MLFDDLCVGAGVWPCNLT